MSFDYVRKPARTKRMARNLRPGESVDYADGTTKTVYSVNPTGPNSQQRVLILHTDGSFRIAFAGSWVKLSRKESDNDIN